MSMTFNSRTRGSLLLAAGDPANERARTSFTECYAGMIRNCCRRSGLQEADQEDVVQTILIRLLEKLPTFEYDPNKRFRGLIQTMVQNAIKDLGRTRQRRPGGCGSGDTGVLNQLQEAPALDDLAVEELSHELAEQVDRDQQLQAACESVRRRVKPNTWQAFWLTTVEDEPVAEVAERLGMPKASVLVHKHRVIKMIREEVEGMAGP